MTKQDLMIGMVVEVERKDKDERNLCMVLMNAYGELCLSGENDWCPLNGFNERLVEYCGDREITKIYDFADSNKHAHEVSSDNRALLWERKKPKELTVSEIEKLLGYPVKIVKE